MHWIRQFPFAGVEYVHGPSYHTKDRKGAVRNTQFASMLPRHEYSALIGAAIEKGIIELPQNTIEFLWKIRIKLRTTEAQVIDKLRQELETLE
jgi:hypothetical protein